LKTRNESEKWILLNITTYHKDKGEGLSPAEGNRS